MTRFELKHLGCIFVWVFLSGLMTNQVSAQTQDDTTSLTDIIISAYSYHPQLKSLRAELYGSREFIVQARAAYLPQVNLTGGIGLSDRDAVLQNGGAFDQKNEPKDLALRLDQTLYDGGRRNLLTQNASLEFQASAARYDGAATSIAAEIIQDYISLLSAIADVEILEQSVTTLEEFEKSVIARRAVGDSTKTELAQAVSRLASARADRASALAELSYARDRLRSKTGFLVERPALPEEANELISLPKEELTDIARHLSPSIKASRLTEQATHLTVHSEKRKHLPTISLSAQAQAVRDSSPTIAKDDNVSIGVNFSMPIYTGGAGSSQTRQALATHNAARFNTQNAIRENDLLIDQLWARLQSGKIVLEAQKANVEANKDALEGITRGEAVGIATTQEVLEAIQNKLTAELAHSRALHRLYTARLLMKLYVGEFDVIKID